MEKFLSGNFCSVSFFKNCSPRYSHELVVEIVTLELQFCVVVHRIGF